LYGCNKCDFSGDTFGKHPRFVGYQRYLPVNDPRRNKTTPGLSFLRAERSAAPEDRSYADYIRDGTAAERDGGIVNGIYFLNCICTVKNNIFIYVQV